MDRQVERALDECIDKVMAGEATIEECLMQHDALLDKLAPKLAVVAKLVTAGQVEPDARARQAVRERLMQAVEERRISRESEAPATLTNARLARRRRALLTRIVIVSAIFTLISGSALVMARESLPGSPLYPIKRAVEDVRVGMVRDSAEKTRLHLTSAEERLSEIQRIDGGSRHYPELVKTFARDIERAEEVSAQSGDDDLYDVLSNLARRNKDVLKDTLDKAPEEAKPVIRRMLKRVEPHMKVRENDPPEPLNKYGRKNKAVAPWAPVLPDTPVEDNKVVPQREEESGKED